MSLDNPADPMRFRPQAASTDDDSLEHMYFQSTPSLETSARWNNPFHADLSSFSPSDNTHGVPTLPHQQQHLSACHDVMATQQHQHTQQHGGHDECYPCDSPDCDEEPCPDTQIACYDENCLENDSVGTLCSDSHQGLCAGALPGDVANGAQLLASLAFAGQNGSGQFSHMFDHSAITSAGQPLVASYANCGGYHQLQTATNDNMNPFQPGMFYHGQVDQNQQFYNYPDPNLFLNQQQSLANGEQLIAISDYCQDPTSCAWNNNASSLFEPFAGCAHFGNGMIESPQQWHLFQHHIAHSAGACSGVHFSQVDPIMDDAVYGYPAVAQETAVQNSYPYSPRTASDSPIKSLSNGQSSTPMSRSSSAQAMTTEEESSHRCEWLVNHPGSGEVCGKEFENAKELQTHLQLDHIKHLTKGGVGFWCRWGDCDRLEDGNKKAFAQKSKLERHLQKHTGYKSEACEVCGKFYATAQTLVQHMKTHNDPKACKCDLPMPDGTICTYATAQASQLTMHKRTMHLNSKPLKCNFPGCGSTFSESSNLSKHKKTHKQPGEYYCGWCGKRFRRDDQVIRHWKRHLKDDDIERNKMSQKFADAGRDVKTMTFFEIVGRTPAPKKAIIFGVGF